MPRNGFRFPVNNWGYLREGIGKIYVCVCVCKCEEHQCYYKSDDGQSYQLVGNHIPRVRGGRVPQTLTGRHHVEDTTGHRTTGTQDHRLQPCERAIHVHLSSRISSHRKRLAESFVLYGENHTPHPNPNPIPIPNTNPRLRTLRGESHSPVACTWHGRAPRRRPNARPRRS